MKFVKNKLITKENYMSNIVDIPDLDTFTFSKY